VNVHALDTRADLWGAKLGVHVRLSRLSQEEADRVKQKSARAAGRIEHVFHQRPVDAVFHRFGGEPVRRVIFAESMALAAVDKGFVEDLENIAFDFGEAEPPDMRHDAAHEFLALRIGHGPIEKITFDGAGNAR
jgi:hypothetical protein